LSAGRVCRSSATQVDASEGGYDSYDDAVNVRAAMLDRLDSMNCW
jgi:hypothetical protein